MTEPLSEGGYLLEKCRLCGEIERQIGVPLLWLAILHITAGVEVPESWHGSGRLHKQSQHRCKDGRLGLTDVIGGEPYNWEASQV